MPPDIAADHSYRAWLLRSRMPAYLRARELYAAVDGSFTGRLSDRLGSCRTRAFFEIHAQTHLLRVSATRCKLRWCPICRDVSRSIVSSSASAWLSRQPYPKMLTLTLRHSHAPLRDQIHLLYDSFVRLRRRKFFRNAVPGGIWFFQVKYNQQRRDWHPHLHCLISGAYLPHKRLKETWHDITQSSYIVDIRPIRDPATAAAEAARYATSPADLTQTDLDHALEIYHATHHRRVCGSWGSARSYPLRPQPQPDSGDWSRVAHWQWISMRRHYDAAARTFWQCYRTATPYLGPQLEPLSALYADALSAFDLTHRDSIDYRTFLRLISPGRAQPPPQPLSNSVGEA